MKTKQELLDELKLELLEIGGVDNWQSYGDAIQEFKEENGFGDDEHPGIRPIKWYEPLFLVRLMGKFRKIYWWKNRFY